MTDKPKMLAEQLLALCAEHGLNSLSVNVHVSHDGSHFFGSYAHAQGVCGSASLCRTNPRAAIGEAISDLHAKLGISSIDVPEMVAASA